MADWMNATPPAGKTYAADVGTIRDPKYTGAGPVQTGSTGSQLGGVLRTVRQWLAQYINVVDDLDLDVLALWAAHTHVAFETYTTPRLMLDSVMPGSGKTTVLEHLQRFCLAPIQAASISSPALLARMLDKQMRTILIDEVDRSLDPKKPGVEDLIAILNSGYKRGATRPVLVPAKGGSWDVAEMSTFSPVAMAGNAPHLPDDTRSRCIRVLLMPDIHGTVTPSDWEEIEADAIDLGTNLAAALDSHRDEIRTARPELPAGCTGRMREKWGPLARVAAIAGGNWPHVVNDLINRDIEEVAMEREEGLLTLPPAMVLLRDMHDVWPTDEPFVSSTAVIELLVNHNPEYWGELSAYGKRLTAQRMGRMLVQGAKIHSTRNAIKVRGYNRAQFVKAWRQLGITPAIEPAEPVRTVPASAEATGEIPQLDTRTGGDPGCCAHGVTIGARCSKCGGTASEVNRG